jgi:hypothetical protein
MLLVEVVPLRGAYISTVAHDNENEGEMHVTSLKKVNAMQHRYSKDEIIVTMSEYGGNIRSQLICSGCKYVCIYKYSTQTACKIRLE